VDDKDLKEQLSDVDGQEPSLHKLDKKMTIIIMQQCETLSMLGKHDVRIESVEKEQAKNRNFAQGAAWIAGSLFTILTGWLAIKK
jgi:hypothetical protein